MVCIQHTRKLSFMLMCIRELLENLKMLKLHLTYKLLLTVYYNFTVPFSAWN